MRPEDASKAAPGAHASRTALHSESPETVTVPQGTSADTPPPGSLAAAEAWIGRTIGKYLITDVLGCGGMGVVLKAYDPMIERDVAIKVLAEHMASDATALGRFLAEAKSAGRVNHPHVMAIYEICLQKGMTYLVLEYVPGGSLKDMLTERGALPVAEATQALFDAC